MHRLATVHAGDNQPTTNDQRRHDTAYLNNARFYELGLTRELTNPRVGVIPSLTLV